MPITDQSVNYFKARGPITIGTGTTGANTTTSGGFNPGQVKYDDSNGSKNGNTILSSPDANNDGILAVGDLFTVSSTAPNGNTESIQLTLSGSGTYTTTINGSTVTRNVLIGTTTTGTPT
ncbi:hypothetical protein [Paracoccus endophyticus]|uniref:hypothetical protein n=1 Tax=Paracoccus endophyticus TaxID=2233774 RepID=UPI000DDB9B45|nr:hypothetical protein [Paracoccus endophyticus]